jgi:hypothetical protein
MLGEHRAEQRSVRDVAPKRIAPQREVVIRGRRSEAARYPHGEIRPSRLTAAPDQPDRDGGDRDGNGEPHRTQQASTTHDAGGRHSTSKFVAR